LFFHRFFAQQNCSGFFLLFLLLGVSNTQAQFFTEAAALHGINLDGVKDGGFAFEDINADGWLDLVVNTDQDDVTHRTRLYISSGPPSWTFTDVTATQCRGCQETAIADGAPERCVVFADFNGDGFPDFVRNSARRLEVFLNKGPAPADGDVPFSFGDALQKPNFSLYTTSINLDNPQFGIPNGMNTEGVGAFDYDNDGDLDLFIENHDWGIDIYQNVGFATGTFVHVTPNSASLGLPIVATDGDYVAVTDVNDDGLVDAIARKRDQLDLFLNVGGSFVPVPSINEQANNYNKGSVAFHDFDNDGDFDLFWTENDSNRIWLQTGLNSGVFAPTAEPWASAGLTDPFDGGGTAIDGLACGDIDNDGDIDLFLADDSGPSYLFINQLSQTGVMSFVRENRGINVQADAEGANFIDFDGDGDLDLYININDGDNQLWVNDLQGSPVSLDYLVVRAFENRDGASALLITERDALGATMQLYDCNGNTLSGIKEVNGGYGHGNQENRLVHFGLPDGPDLPYLVEVRYVSLAGLRTIVRQPAVPSSLGSGQLLVVRPQDPSSGCNLSPVALPDFASGCPGQTLTVFPLANDTNPDGAPLNPASLTILSGPFSGSVSYDPLTGELLYVPTDGSVLADSLLYQICDAEGACATAQVSFQFDGSLDVNALLQQPFCPGFEDGAIALSTSGGTPPYTYQWNTGDTASTILGLGAGIYTVLVEDALGCSQTVSYTLTDPDSLLLTLTATDATSLGICDGTASVSVIGGVAPYSYLWSPGGETDSALVGLCAGAYFVVVTDAKGCSASGSVVVSAPECDLVVALLPMNPVCGGQASGAVSSLVSGGTTPYTYLWLPGGQDSDAIVGQFAGTYAVVVTDALGCVITASVELTEPDPLEINVVSTGVSGPGASDGTASVAVIGGTPAYTYLWNTGATTSSIDGLAPGVYSVVVTDAVGCSAMGMVQVADDGCSLEVVILSQPISCNGLSDGQLTALPVGGTAPFTYAWNDGQVTAAAIGLGAATYSVVVTDAVGCSAVAMASLTDPTELALNLSGTGPGCAGAGDGNIDLSVSGGTSPYTYLWSNGATTEDLSGLTSGTYAVQVTDGAGCIAEEELVLPDGSLLSLTASIINPESCAGAGDGSALLVASGGVAPYSYFWPDLASVSPFQSGLSPGTYTVEAEDAAGCVLVSSIEIIAANPLLLSGLLIQPTCVTDATGSIDLTVSGGQSPYTFLWSNGFAGEDPGSLSSGLYSVLVTDASGCTASGSFTLNPVSSLALNVLAVEPTCGEDNGQASAFVVGAAGPVTYTWSDGQTTAVATDLAPGFYTVEVSDGLCTASASVALGSSAGPSLVLSATAAACGGTDGTASVVASGVGPFSYAWSDGQTTATAIGLAAGNYSVLVTDANGCVSPGSATVEETNTLALSTAVIPPTACGLSDGLANAVASGGTPPYSYAWSNGDAGSVADSLATGLYTVVVTDALGCSAEASVAVADGFGLSLALTATGANCGAADGSALVVVGAGSGPYTYLWSNGATTAGISGLSAGVYTVLVSDASGCSDVGTVTVDGSTGFVAVLSSTPVSCAGGDGSISASVSGGSEPYTYTWSTGASTPGISGLSAGTYTVQISDNSGCQVSDSLVLGTDCAGPPLAINDTVATHEGVFLVIDVLQNDIDSSGTPGPPIIVLPPSNGSAVVLPDSTIGYTPNPGFIGIDSLQYQICNADGCSTATVIIYVGIGNNPPVAMPDAASTEPGVPVLIPIGNNDFDPDSDPLTWTLYEAPNHGSVGVGDGIALYVPDAGFAGVDTFVYVLCDPAGLCDTALVVVTVEGPGAGLPLAVDDFSSTGVSTPVAVDVLANDLGGSSPLDPGSVVLTSGPEQGSAAVDPVTGIITYTPDAGFIGVDSFRYQVCNTAGFCDEALVIVTVGETLNPPVAVNDAATTPEGTPVWIPILANDSDPDGDLLLPPVILTPPLNGTVVILPDGSVIYTPFPGFFGLDVFTYQICDAEGLCDDAVVFITVTPVNEPPIAVDDYTSTEPGVPVIVPVLGNDSDPDGDPLTVTVIGGPFGGGSVVLNPDGTLTYFPGPDGTTDTLIYVACDPSGACDTALVIITVGSTDNPPVVGNDSTSTLACLLVVTEVLINDVDPDGDNLEISITAAPAFGVAIATDDQKIVYLPPIGFVGVVTIGYQACDPLGNCTEGTLVIHVLPPFLPPAAFDDGVLVLVGSTVGVAVLANDFSPHGHALLGPTVVTPPVSGSATVNPDGSITYVPDEGFIGTDSLQYSICDTVSSCLDDLRCDEAWVYFVVFDLEDPDDPNLPPVAVDDEAVTPEDSPVVIDILANDFDPDGDPLTVTLLDPPANGSAVLNADGTVTYTPNSGFEGCDTFSYFICDPGGLCDTAIVVVCIEPGFFIPDVITPNGDGSNDFFVITGLESYPNNGLTVYNRWGDEVYAAQPYQNDWQGTYKDRGNLPDGTYYFVFQPGDGSKPVAGYLAIFR